MKSENLEKIEDRIPSAEMEIMSSPEVERLSSSVEDAASRLNSVTAEEKGGSGVRVIETDVKSENSNDSIVKYRGKRYNIKELLKKHPGGSKVLKLYGGLNIDEAMVTNSHSVAAFHFFEEFLEDNQHAYQDIEKLVDWNAPLLLQVGSLGDRYWEWVNLPVNRSIRLFSSDTMERLTVTPWYMVPVFWIPISILFIYCGWSIDLNGNVANSIPQIIIAFSWGLLLWTLLEYTLHRKLFHMKPPPHSKALITMHFLLHGLHHKAPFDSQRLVFPPVPAMFLGLIIYIVYRSVLPISMIHFVSAGIAVGYLCYDMTHYYLHYGSPKAETYMYVLKRHHNYHHFSHHDLGFGISNRLWDYVFGTMISLRILKKPLEW